MCGKIDCYIEAFSNLKTDKNKLRWSAATTYRSPHKPLLLLSILDLIAAKKINREFIEPSPELAEAYGGYWQQVMQDGSQGNMAIPFYNMDKESFWELVPRPGKGQPSGRVRSMKRLKEYYLGARIDEELFKLCLMEVLRERLRAALVGTYFA